MCLDQLRRNEGPSKVAAREKPDTCLQPHQEVNGLPDGLRLWACDVRLADVPWHRSHHVECFVVFRKVWRHLMHLRLLIQAGLRL